MKMNDLTKIGAGQYDALMGLYTATSFITLMDVSNALDGLEHPTLIYINITGFKIFNQSYGFEAGNHFLCEIADELRRHFDGDWIARLGGDRFIIETFGKNLTAIEGSLSAIQANMRLYERGLLMRIKSGIFVSSGTESPMHMIDCAKLAHDTIEDSYTKDIAVYDEKIAKSQSLRHYIVTDFVEAKSSGYIMPFYQREVRALTGECAGYEALARWVDPTNGLIMPGLFIGVLENAHLIHQLDLHIIRCVIKDLRRAIDRGLPVVPVSVNLSRHDFLLCDVFDEVNSLRAANDIPPQLLNIEITEGAFAEGAADLIEAIEKFKAAGYKIWMDDFGSGTSTLNNLRQHDFDVVKLDMNFLRDFETNPKCKVILASIVSMTKELGSHTLCEGVETKEQYEFLRRIGCERLQGYYFGKPMALDFEHSTTSIVFEGDSAAKAHAHEKESMRRYYDMVGGVNVMGAAPLREKDMLVYNNLPITIIELIDDNIHFLYANAAYGKLLKGTGIESLTAADSRANIRGIKENDEFLAFAKRVKESCRTGVMDFVINGKIIATELHPIASADNRSAFVAVSHDVSQYNETRQAKDMQVVLSYLLTLFFRIDLFDLDDGTVDNVFLSSSQGRVTDEDTDAASAVAKYAEKYITPAEQGNFCKFYDMTTVEERIKAAKDRYVSAIFHAKSDNRRQIYQLLIFHMGTHKKVLSCCRSLKRRD